MLGRVSPALARRDCDLAFFEQFVIRLKPFWVSIAPL
jgi:hypothetical protein